MKPTLITINLVLISSLLASGCATGRNHRAQPIRFAAAKPEANQTAEKSQRTSVGLVGYQDGDPQQLTTRSTRPTTMIESLEQIPSVGQNAPLLDFSSSRPLTRSSKLPLVFRRLSLDEAITLALNDTTVLRSLSATVVQNPAGTRTEFDPAITRFNPNFGVDAAISAFDPRFNSSAVYANNDDYFNNPSTTGNAFEVQQDLTTMNFAFDRVNQNGTRFRLSNALTHDNTTNPTVLFPSSWENQTEATIRKPLLQGAGLTFNRIAGPNSRPGFLGTSGILISQLNHDLSIGDFQRDIREFILEIIDVYWQLELAYQNFDSIKAARDTSLATWEVALTRAKNGLPGGEADREAQARSQFYLFQQQLDRALNSSTDTGQPGVLQAEANLRRLLNLPLSDQELLKPSDQPIQVDSLLDWNQLAADAASRRVEVLQQQRRIRQRDLELIAAKNFLLPRLDALATYRNSGLGNDLIGGGGKFAGALNESWAGNYDEWEFGFAVDIPLGYRQARAGVRHAQLQACRERAVLTELQQQILHDLGSVFRTLDQARANVRFSSLRAAAAEDTVNAREAAFEADAVVFEDLLDAQQRLLEAKLDRHQAQIDRERAMAQLNAQAGRLLAEYRVFLR